MPPCITNLDPSEALSFLEDVLLEHSKKGAYNKIKGVSNALYDYTSSVEELLSVLSAIEREGFTEENLFWLGHRTEEARITTIRLKGSIKESL